MRLAALFTAVAGIAVAGGSVYLARDYLVVANAAPVVDTENQTVSVIVASRDIAFGEVIDAPMLTTIDWPRDAVPDGVYSAANVLLPANGQQPRRARRAISQGDPLRMATISDFGEKVTIVQTLSPNTRAMAITVSAETGVAGFVTPGDRVDLVLTQGGNQELTAVTILQNIRVIGVDQDTDQLNDTPGVARTVTVEVSAEQGQRLALAQRAGKLSLTLRSLDDTDDVELRTTRLSDLLYDAKPTEPDEPVQQRPVIRVRRGNELTDTLVN
jgi:pilus assembly protein CpaB